MEVYCVLDRRSDHVKYSLRVSSISGRNEVGSWDDLCCVYACGYGTLQPYLMGDWVVVSV